LWGFDVCAWSAAVVLMQLPNGNDPVDAQVRVAGDAHAVVWSLQASDLDVVSCEPPMRGQNKSCSKSYALISPEGNGFFQPADQAALPLLFAATSSAATPGEYYGPSGSGERKGVPALAMLPPQARDEARAAKLWSFSERLVNFTYPALHRGSWPTTSTATKPAIRACPRRAGAALLQCISGA
jgi:hypothetical protein